MLLDTAPENREIAAPAATKPRTGAPLTDSALSALKPRDKAYKVTARAGMYVAGAPSGAKSFRYASRLEGKRETLTIGRYEPGMASRTSADMQSLDYGAAMSLADARALRDRS